MMKRFLLLCLVVFVFSQSTQTSYVVDANPTYCNRRMNLDVTPDAKSVTITSNAACALKYDRVNATSLQFFFTAGNNTSVQKEFKSSVPTFGIGTNFKKFPVDPSYKLGGTKYFAYVAFDQYVFYQDTDGEQGYQPNKDTILRRQYLNDSLATSNKFDSFMKSSVDLDGNGNNYHRFTVQMLREFSTALISTSMELSSMDIYPFNSTSARKFVTPNALRFTTKIEGITNFPALANGCAVSAVICAPTQVFSRKPAITSSGNFTRDLAQETNPFQVAYSLEDFGVKNSSFFSVRNLVNILPANKKPSFDAQVYSTDPVNLGLEVDSELPMVNSTTHQFWRVWMSVSKTADATDTYVFEAAFGLDEPVISGALRMGVSVLLCLVVVLFVY